MMSIKHHLLTLILLSTCVAWAQAEDATLPPPSEAELAAKAAQVCRPGDCDRDRILAAQKEEWRLRDERVAAHRAAQRAAECASTFNSRAKAAQAKYKVWVLESAEYERQQAAFVKANGPKLMEFFGAHCRFLSELETAVRRLNDPNTIVCNRPKPKGLSAQLVMYGSVESSPPSLHLELDTTNTKCQESDSKERFSLAFDVSTKDTQTLIAEQSLLCYEDQRPSCEKARAAVEALKAKLSNRNLQAAASATASDAEPPVSEPTEAK